jgi:hypothetical protein
MAEPTRLDPALDEALSALVDGELDESRSRELRERAESEPRIARRLAELESLNAQLRALALPQVSASLRAKLQERIDGEARAVAKAQIRRLPRPSWAAATALAAGFALYLVLGTPTREPGGVPGPADPLSDLGISDDELAIGLDYEVLRNFELIDQLELLEALAASEEAEGAG